MRLTKSERQTIREVVSDLTGGRAQAIIFGSRLNEQAHGGDIDLLVESPEAVDQPARLAALIGARLESRLGEQRIDVLIGAPNLKRLPVHESARRDGAAL
jgi:predicted nucleotidyltransferase